MLPKVPMVPMDQKFPKAKKSLKVPRVRTNPNVQKVPMVPK